MVAQRLRQAADRAQKAGFPVKVVLVRTRHDLEQVERYMGKPTAYATVLGRAISYYFGGTLIVAMPDGLGASGPLPPDMVRGVLASVRVNPRASSDDLARAATTAVNRLVQRGSAARAAEAGSGWLAPAAGPTGAAAAIALAAAFVHRRRRTRAREEALRPTSRS